MAFSARKVLLAVQGEQVDARLFSAATNLAKRMNAGLEILLCGDRNAPPAALTALLQNLTNDEVPYRLDWHAALAAREVVRYANTHECITCVVIDAPENWPGPAGAWDKLACPLVVTAQAKGLPASP